MATSKSWIDSRGALRHKPAHAARSLRALQPRYFPRADTGAPASQICRGRGCAIESLLLTMHSAAWCIYHAVRCAARACACRWLQISIRIQIYRYKMLSVTKEQSNPSNCVTPINVCLHIFPRKSAWGINCIGLSIRNTIWPLSSKPITNIDQLWRRFK